MNDSPRLWYLNALFDLELGRAPVAGLRKGAVEMQCLFMPVGRQGDRVYIACDLPPDFIPYLRDRGLCLAPPAGAFSDEPMIGSPWGWSAGAVAVLQHAGASCVHPPLETVRMVNCRRFCFQLGQCLGAGVPGGVWCESPGQVEAAVNRYAGAETVVKPAYGSAGHGFLRIAPGAVIEEYGKQVCTLVGRSDCGVLVEPWCDRVMDIASRYYIHRSGRAEKIGDHRSVNTQSGAFFAIWLEPEDQALSPWRERLDDCFGEATRALAGRGYWGPVSFDSFIYQTRGGERDIALMIEINARYAMSAIAYALRDQLGGDRISLFRFISRRRHVLPDSYTELETALAGDMFSARTRCGALPVTPLRVRHPGGGWRQPARSAFFISGYSVQDVNACDRRLREKLKRTRL